MNVRLLHGSDIPKHKRQTEVPAGAVFVFAFAMIIFALGGWKACELVVWLVKKWHEVAP